VALAALDGVGGRAAGRGGPSNLGRCPPPPTEEVERPQAMADPVYDGINVITVTFALVLAGAIVFLLAQLRRNLRT
jgi:hypothetical protein